MILLNHRIDLGFDAKLIPDVNFVLLYMMCKIVLIIGSYGRMALYRSMSMWVNTSSQLVILPGKAASRM